MKNNWMRKLTLRVSLDNSSTPRLGLPISGARIVDFVVVVEGEITLVWHGLPLLRTRISVADAWEIQFI